jgi:hypothetical protein
VVGRRFPAGDAHRDRRVNAAGGVVERGEGVTGLHLSERNGSGWNWWGWWWMSAYHLSEME